MGVRASKRYSKATGTTGPSASRPPASSARVVGRAMASARTVQLVRGSSQRKVSVPLWGPATPSSSGPRP